jgi:hypothetical protein
VQLYSVHPFAPPPPSDAEQFTIEQFVRKALVDAHHTPPPSPVHPLVKVKPDRLAPSVSEMQRFVIPPSIAVITGPLTLSNVIAFVIATRLNPYEFPGLTNVSLEPST